MKRQKIYLALLLLCMTAVLLYNLDLVFRKNTAIGDLEKVLQPIRTVLPRHQVLSFRSNNLSPEFFFRAEFVMAPVVLEHSQTNDTLLYLQDLGLPQATDSLLQGQYDTLMTNTGTGLCGLLLKRKQ